MPGEGFDPWITIKKFFLSWITAAIGTLLPFTITFVQDFDWPPEMILYVPIIVAILVALENAWKHWND